MCRKASIASYTHRTQDTNRNEISFVDVLPHFISCIAALASRARGTIQRQSENEATKHLVRPSVHSDMGKGHILFPKPKFCLSPESAAATILLDFFLFGEKW